MALLEHVESGIRHVLAARDIVGRSQRCDLRVQTRCSSGEHAIIQWIGSTWTVRDLGSRNGTQLERQRVDPGISATLPRGAIIAFGGEAAQWRLVDDTPPVAMARPLESDAWVFARDGLLALPNEDSPRATVYTRPGGVWVFERDGVEAEVEDHRTVDDGERTWVLRLPEALSGTEFEGTQEANERLTLRFRVSRDEEHVELVATVGGRSHDLGTRAHHHVLLLLARARAEDARDAAVPASSHGWLYQDDASRALNIDEGRLNTDIFRARRHLGAAGIPNAVGVIERRSDTRQIRLGTDRVEFETL